MSASPDDAKNLSFSQDLSLSALFGIEGKNCVVTVRPASLPPLPAIQSLPHLSAVWLAGRWLGWLHSWVPALLCVLLHRRLVPVARVGSVC
jgi:hypothetical protein